MAGDSNKSQTGPPKAVSFGANGQVNGDSGDQDARALRRSSTGVQGCASLHAWRFMHRDVPQR